MRIRKHPNLDLWCREDGAVCLPPDGKKYKKFRWTFGWPDKEGYLRIRFQGKLYPGHRLIAQTFLDNTLNLPTVDHYPDRNPSNNRLENLRWADRKMQNNNRQFCEDSKAKYGVRSCEDKKAYNASYRAKRRALGKHYRTCPDGSRRWLTDQEFSSMFG